jgi:predicted CXXCH cytochrome family protein
VIPALVGAQRLLLLAVLGTAGCSQEEAALPAPIAPGEAAFGYVGSAACAGCHAGEYAAWQTSDHRRAWMAADAESVQGDFDDARLEVHGNSVGFEREGDAFFVVTEGRDGIVARQPVSHTFGVDPLQQYLVPQPGGRLQVLPYAWDTRPRADGGQRWYTLYPDEHLAPGDPLHWTGWAQNWNAECAECHATHLSRSFDVATSTFATTWAEMGVGCEACHGPGSAHVRAPAQGHLAVLAASTQEVDVCAPCHALRAPLGDDYRAGEPFLDHYLPALALPPMYQGDGQILEEVFEYGSFLQSRMHAAGVRCSDCHDSHSGRLRQTGNALCTRCHSKSPAAEFPGLQEIAGDYDSTAHHMHVPGSEGSLCVSCHMPTRTYMGVDRRRDHGFRVPRPDLTLEFGVDNACTQCHVREAPAWARDAIRNRSGREPRVRPADLLAAGDRRLLAVEPDLAALAADAHAPMMARANAIALLAHYPRGYAVDAIRAGLASTEPLLVLAALAAADRLPVTTRRAAVAPLLRAERRAVRIEAARVLASERAALGEGETRAALDAAIDEYRAVQRADASSPQSHTNLGVLEQRLGDVVAAEKHYLRAIEIDPTWVAARVNLADLYRATGRDDEGGAMLEAVAREPLATPAVHYALGLWHVRRGEREEALRSLAAAAEGTRADPRFVYAYALALNDAGDADAALTQVRRALATYPDDLDLLELAAMVLRDQGRRSDAIAAARRLDAALPGNARAAALLESLGAARARR